MLDSYHPRSTARSAGASRQRLVRRAFDTITAPDRRSPSSRHAEHATEDGVTPNDQLSLLAWPLRHPRSSG